MKNYPYDKALKITFDNEYDGLEEKKNRMFDFNFK